MNSKQSVSPGAVGQGDVPHPGRICRRYALQCGANVRIWSQFVPCPFFSRRFGPGKVPCIGVVDLRPVGKPLRETFQHKGRVGADELRALETPVPGRRVGIYLYQCLREREPVVAGLVAAKARARHDNGIQGLIEGFGFGCHVECTEAQRVILADDPPAVHRGHHADALVHQPGDRVTGVTGAAAEPQQRPPGLPHGCRQLIQVRRIRPDHRHVQRRNVFGNIHGGRLDIRRNLHAHRPVGGRQRHLRRDAENVQRLFRLGNAERGLRDGLQHFQLCLGLVDVGHALVEVWRVDLTGNVQQRCSGGLRLDQRAGPVAGPRAGAGETDAQAIADPRIGVRHVDRARLAPAWDEPDFAGPADCIQDRHVVDADDAEGGADAAGVEKCRDEVADSLSLIRQSGILLRRLPSARR